MQLARSHIEFCLWIWPFDSSTFLLAARIERLDEKPRQANKYLERCLDLQGRANPSKEYQLEAVLWRADNGEFNSVEQGLCNWLDGNKERPETPLVLESLARGYLRQHQFRELEFRLEQWLKLEPDNPRALSWRGWFFENLDLDYDAGADYAKAVKLAPHNMQLRIQYVVWLLNGNNAVKAKEHIQQLLQRKGDDPNVQALYGKYLFQMEQMAKARKVLQGVVTVNPKQTDASFHLAKLEFQMGNFDKAEDWARQTIKNRYGLTEAHFLLYQILNGRSGKEKEASSRLKLHNKIKALNDRAQTLVNSLLKTGEFDAETYAKIGETYLELRLDAGVRWLKLALQKDKNHKAAHQLLARYYLKKGQAELADFHRKASSVSSQQPSPGS